MSEKIVQLNEEVVKGQIKELVRGNVELQYILDRGKKRVRLERPSGIVELQHN